MGFFFKESLILSALKQNILNEIEQLNGKKKIYFFKTFCKFLPPKGIFVGKCLLNMFFTFYLKHQKYPFCAPIFHPISENESYEADLSPPGNSATFHVYQPLILEHSINNVNIIFFCKFKNTTK